MSPQREAREFKTGGHIHILHPMVRAHVLIDTVVNIILIATLPDAILSNQKSKFG
jgi:hypothetical protein